MFSPNDAFCLPCFSVLKKVKPGNAILSTYPLIDHRRQYTAKVWQLYINYQTIEQPQKNILGLPVRYIVLFAEIYIMAWYFHPCCPKRNGCSVPVLMLCATMYVALISQMHGGCHMDHLSLWVYVLIKQKLWHELQLTYLGNKNYRDSPTTWDLGYSYAMDF